MGLQPDRLRSVRERKGISQRELARLCGLGEVMVHRYEGGISDPSSKYLTMLAQKLEVSTDYLVGLSDSPNGPIDSQALNDDEQHIIEKFRGEGWPGIVRLGAEHLTK